MATQAEMRLWIRLQRTTEAIEREIRLVSELSVVVQNYRNTIPIIIILIQFSFSNRN